jgi:hypothetical protein
VEQSGTDAFLPAQKELDMTKLRIAARYANLEAYEAWLKNVPWQLFCTFTFAWRVSDPQALRVFREFTNRLEKLIRGPIVFVRGDEKRFSGCGMPGAPRHFHSLLAAHQRLNPQVVADLWMDMAGRRENGAGANVRIYDPNLGGLAYTLKFINEPDGDWALGNLDLFLQRSPKKEMTHRERRRLSRHSSRVNSSLSKERPRGHSEEPERGK